MSVNPAEIAKFDALANEWWDPRGPMKPLHLLNPYRLQAIINQIDLANKTILDIGCGGGLLSEAMAREKAYVTGIDLSESLIQVASQHAHTQGLKIDYRFQSSTQLAKEAKQSFDVITCMELLEHVPEPDKLIQECAEILKPGGLIFFATLNRNWQSFLKAIISAEYLLRLLPKGTHQYSQFIRPSELTLWASRHGLILKGFQGFSYNPLFEKFSLSNDISVNYMAFYSSPLIHYENAA
jgi:2-polyprenyl-6-hydroxyphenyl methylase/3-demethylubiquinone-9 3-methyltransferase